MIFTSQMKEITPERVLPTIGKHMLTDGMQMVLDMEKSRGPELVDKLTGKRYIDFFSFYASNPLGMNHPKMLNDEAFSRRLMEAAVNKVTNSDIYTEHLARFVNTFSRVGIPDYLPYTFFVSGGSLAVENALKAAFDWKVRSNFRKGYRTERGQMVLHFEQAFHGRSGYTLSLTNTADPKKTAYFPKFDWPRVISPNVNKPLTEDNLREVERMEQLAIAQCKIHFRENPDDIACIIIEPIQAEGGDNHFRPEFLQALRDLAYENDCLLIFDEVQTGVGLTGHFWAHQGLGVRPDILAFGKKTQVCGILAGRRLDTIDDHVFRVVSRINSTWGGNLVDMVRFDRILEIIEEDELVDNAAQVGEYLLQRLREMAESYAAVENPRGRGLMCAMDLPSAEFRDLVRKECFNNGLIILGCGTRTLRFRPSLPITTDAIDEGLDILDQVIRKTVA